MRRAEGRHLAGEGCSTARSGPARHRELSAANFDFDKRLMTRHSAFILWTDFDTVILTGR